MLQADEPHARMLRRYAQGRISWRRRWCPAGRLWAGSWLARGRERRQYLWQTVPKYVDGVWLAMGCDCICSRLGSTTCGRHYCAILFPLYAPQQAVTARSARCCRLVTSRLYAYEEADSIDPARSSCADASAQHTHTEPHTRLDGSLRCLPRCFRTNKTRSARTAPDWLPPCLSARCRLARAALQPRADALSSLQQVGFRRQHTSVI